MGRHSQTSSWGTTLVELGSLASRGLPNASTGQHGRRRAPGAAKTSAAPMMFRAGGVAAALSLAVSGGAYAATTQLGDGNSKPLNEGQTSLAAIGANAPGHEADASGGDVTWSQHAVTVDTATEDVTEAHGQVKQETPDLPEGETKVQTEGVDGVVRTTYEITYHDGVETSRVPLTSVTVTEKVDEVVLVGTGSAEAAGGGGAATEAAGGGTAEAAGGGGAAVTGNSGADGTTPEGAKQIARSMMSGYGWGEDQFSCLESLWTRESGWNYQAENPGSGAYGIPQALPGSKMGASGGDWATNPTTQITWGLGYIEGRYGNPCGAWAHSEATGWY